ncbi:MAG TPA: Rieske (2Fe-2S) protein, partial [Candidatus Limnocylindrales bacterium]|nr:Rieske (2Fe-2S) protein [Candidatus Limnocylindrales bacterium]
PEEKTAARKPLIRSAEISEGTAKLVRVNNQEIAVFKHEGRLCALQNICPHEGGQLSAGWIDNGAAVCPLHGYRFDLASGACANDAKLKAKVFKLAADGENYTVEE